MVKEHNIQKGKIYCVYDKDSFPAKDFNAVEYRVQQLNRQNSDLQYFAAWSNECIEFWFLLHLRTIRLITTERSIFHF